MKIRVKWLWANAMAIWPFIFFKKETLGIVTERHERIHHKQQIEMLLIFFYAWYLIEYLIRLIQKRKHNDAYRAISFEKEAYANARNPTYLEKRVWYAWVKYL